MNQWQIINGIMKGNNKEYEPMADKNQPIKRKMREEGKEIYFLLFERFIVVMKLYI